MDGYVADVEASVELTSDRLDGAQYGTFDVISVILGYDDLEQLRTSKDLRASRPDEAMPNAVHEAFDRLEAVLEDVHVARQYFKTIYVQQDLADLSKSLLYAGALTFVVGGGLMLGLESLLSAVGVVATAVGITTVFVPFAVLLSYVPRIATVAHRTAADFGPFHLQEDVQSEDREPATR